MASRSTLRTGRAAVPFAARWLTGLGVIPFLALAPLAAFTDPYVEDHATVALWVYGAVILSFIGGIRWGLAIAPGRSASAPALWQELTVSVAPSLLAWLALLMPAGMPPLALSVGFAVMLLADWRAARRGLAPAWYPRLRWPPTLAAIASLLLAAFL